MRLSLFLGVIVGLLPSVATADNAVCALETNGYWRAVPADQVERVNSAQHVLAGSTTLGGQGWVCSFYRIPSDDARSRKTVLDHQFDVLGKLIRSGVEETGVPPGQHLNLNGLPRLAWSEGGHPHRAGWVDVTEGGSSYRFYFVRTVLDLETGEYVDGHCQHLDRSDASREQISSLIDGVYSTRPDSIPLCAR